jgi:two-component system, NtrC family, response regulator HydG
VPRALIVDDDPDIREALADVAGMEGFETATASSLTEARQKLAKNPPDVILADLMLPDGKGLDLLEVVEDAPRPQVVLITGNATVETAVAALRTGARDYLTKPVDVPRLKAILTNISRTLALQEEIGALRGQLRQLGRFGSMIGNSAPMQRAYDLVAKVAPTDAGVLVVGESGTGKELVAQTLHELGPRRKGPFLPVNCGAVPSNLIESELFGHERGSFTGATQQHRGFFERASGGTLFLDEITEMPPDLQTKLLRVLETGLVSRIGGESPIQVNVRLVAATNRPPHDAVREGKLREDLFYRLNVFPIVLPPLRDRGRDVELLAEHFLDRLNQAEGTNKVLSPEAREAMRRHSWPGNVRELKNVIQRAFILSESTIGPDLLGFETLVTTHAAGARSGGGISSITVGLPLDDVERIMIQATLEQCGGDKRRTADVLGISLKTLYNRLNLYANRTVTSPPE